MPKAKAIGTPMPTQAATITTKNTIRLPKPMASSTGWPIHSSAAMPPTVSSARPKLRHVVVSSRRSSAMTAASAAADQHGDDAVAVGDLQRDQLDEALLIEILRGRQQDLQHEGDHHQRGDGGEPARPMLAAPSWPAWSAACGRRGAAPPPCPASTATGTGSWPVRRSRTAGCRARSATPRRRTG